jgi:uncharacterized protein (TIGR01244 family)
MQTKQLTENLLVSPQLAIADVAAVGALGVRSIINNRSVGRVFKSVHATKLPSVNRPRAR